MSFTKIVMKTKHRNSDFDIIVGYRFLFHVTYYYRVSSSVLDEAGTKKKTCFAGQKASVGKNLHFISGLT